MAEIFILSDTKRKEKALPGLLVDKIIIQTLLFDGFLHQNVLG